MVVLGLKYRDNIFKHGEILPDVKDDDNEKLSNMLGFHKDSNTPVNILNYVEDSRFIDAFKRPTKIPTCHDKRVLKPAGCDTFAENERFNDYLVGEIEDAKEKISNVRSAAEKRRIEAAKDTLRKESQSVDNNSGNNSNNG